MVSALFYWGKVAIKTVNYIGLACCFWTTARFYETVCGTRAKQKNPLSKLLISLDLHQTIPGNVDVSTCRIRTYG